MYGWIGLFGKLTGLLLDLEVALLDELFDLRRRQRTGLARHVRFILLDALGYLLQPLDEWHHQGPRRSTRRPHEGVPLILEHEQRRLAIALLFERVELGRALDVRHRTVNGNVDVRLAFRVRDVLGGGVGSATRARLAGAIGLHAAGGAARRADETPARAVEARSSVTAWEAGHVGDREARAAVLTVGSRPV